MTARTHSLLRIRDQFRTDGPAVALDAVRTAFEAGRIDPLDVPEALLALRSGSCSFFEKLGHTPPGVSRHYEVSV